MDLCPLVPSGGSAEYAALLVAIVGAIVRLLKGNRWLPADAVPLAAVLLGVVCDIALCHVCIGRAGTVGLTGALAGLGAAGGHEALARMLRAATGSGRAGDVLLGRARRR